MKLQRLGRTGLKVTEVCLGTMTFGYQCDEQASFGIMGTAADLGVNFIDTADVYPVPVSLETAGRTEEIVGRWLRGKRDDFVLGTKCRMQMGPRPNDVGLSRKHVLSAIDASLKRLQTDYIDLYQVHAPDPDTPIDETLDALDSIVRSGKARYVGCSNFQAWQLAKSLWTSDRLRLARFDSVQPRYNLLFREIEHELLPLCQDQGVGVIVYNPLAGGFLTGKHRSDAPPADNTRFAVAGGLYMDRYWNDSCFEAVGRLRGFLEARGKSLTHAALAWVLKQPVVTAAIVGATSADQLRDSLRGTEVELDQEELEQCDRIWYELPRARDPRIALR
ncbi:MAG TPA: aldo/keto reductase [Blastocatellia bacterium]|nr:aldo/keto reductase [Blastocatellia bacterium]